MGLFTISRKLQFRVCNHGKSHASSPDSKGMSMLMQRGKGSWEGCSNGESIAFHWLSPCQKRSFSSSCGSATVARYERTPSDLPTLFNWGLSSVHGILQARILEWVAIPFRGSSWPRDQTQISCIVGRLLTIWTTREGSEILNVSFRTNFLYHRHKLGGLVSSSRGVFGVSHIPEKADLKLNIQKAKIMASGPIISWQIDEETVETATDFIFLGSKLRWFHSE